MGYQALLFCSDEKLARVVGQVFSELDFSVEAVNEPFAAVKKLMTQRYDAIAVDCENEQNASLLFKSARNSSTNQSSLALALVEGQAGVAKAYRIGANLVLTKPINVEQAKGTLRVARGLLRKNSDAASAAAHGMQAKTTPISAGNSFPLASRSSAATAPPPSAPEPPEFEAPIEAPMTATMPEALAAGLPTMTALAKVEDNPAVVPAPAAQSKTAIAAGPALESRQPEFAGAVKNDLVKNDVVKNDGFKNKAANIAATSVAAQDASSAFTSASGSAAAPAPAKEVTAPATKENKIVKSKVFESKSAELKAAGSKPAVSGPASPSHEAATVALPTSNSVSTTGAPSFAVALDEDDSRGAGGVRKILMVVVAVLALAALGYLGYGELGKSSKTPARQPVSSPQPQDSRQPAPALAPMSSPEAAPSTSTPGRASSATPTLAPKTATAAPQNKPSAGASNPQVIRIDANVAANSEPGTKKDSAPLRVKSGNKTPAQAEESAPSLPSPLTVASADDSNLKGLISSASSNLPKPSLATIKISQGVSQGLLIKRVQPVYPPAALKVHAEGAVQIEATINKEGTVINPKVLRGDAVLARAALDAVRQWRYKPYYLDGEPVEIQTQITVNFKAN
ncbi:MAG TPA: TonB family protein [Terriglobales bacterium]|nr:TonB family protein [Terriglobales bacterium]